MRTTNSTIRQVIEIVLRCIISVRPEILAMCSIDHANIGSPRRPRNVVAVYAPFYVIDRIDF